MSAFIFFCAYFGFSASLFLLWEVQRLKRKRKKTVFLLSEFVEEINSENITTVLKERNLVNFAYQEKQIKLDVAHNGKTLYVNLQYDLLRNDDFESVYSFEYDFEKDMLLFTSRSHEFLTRQNLYKHINKDLAKLADKLIGMDWEAKRLQKEEVVKEGITEAFTSSTTNPIPRNGIEQEFELIQHDMEFIIDNIELLNEEEQDSRTIRELLEKDVSELVSFYTNLHSEEKEKYSDIIEGKVKEIKEKINEISFKIQERKYEKFQEKLQQLTLTEKPEE